MISRTSPDETTQKRLTALHHEKGARIEMYSVDVGDKQQIKALLTSIQKNKNYPLKGIFHAAGLIEDAPLDKQTAESFDKVFAPKAVGAWNLHEITCKKNIHLDYFVLFSSMASLMGSAGQGNYAMANSFLDALAQQRQNENLPALSINWGPWAEVGMATKLVTEYQRRGVLPLTTQEGLDLLSFALKLMECQVGLMHVNWIHMSEGINLIPSWLESLLKGTIKTTFVKKLQETPEDQREELLKLTISREIKKVLGLSDTFAINPTKSIFEMGIDSLMALELKNRLSSILGYTLTNTIAFDFPTLETLTQELAYILKITQQSKNSSLELIFSESKHVVRNTLNKRAQSFIDEMSADLGDGHEQ